MTNLFAALTLLTAIGLLAADHFLWQLNLPVVLGRWLADMVEWLAVWR